MNCYECDGMNIFMRGKTECSTQPGEAKLNRTFHLSPNENICTIARMKTFSICFIQHQKYWSSFRTPFLFYSTWNDFASIVE